MLLHHIKIAFRNLRKYKSQTVIGVLGLATASVVFAIICYLLFFVFSQNADIPHNEWMYELRTRNYRTSIRGGMEQTLAGLSGIEKFTAFKRINNNYGHLLMEGNKPDRFIRLQLIEADTAFLSFFSLKIIMGNPQTILNTPNSIVLYERTAKKYGTPDSLQGRSIIINDIAYTITGILKNTSLNNSYGGGDGLVFNQENGYFQQIHETWNPESPTVIVMLAKGISKNNFQTVLDAYPFDFAADSDSDNEGHVYIASVRGEFRLAQLLIVSLVVITGLMVLSVALFNIISFQTAQFYNRLRECAIRKLVGSGKRQLLFSFYMEIVIVFVLSYFTGLIVIDFLKPILQQFGFNLNMSMIDSIDGMASGMKIFLLYSILFGLLITFLFCLIPVRIISRQSVRVVFMGLSEKVSRQRGRKMMLFVQMFIMLLFLSVTLVIRLQVNRVKDNIWHTLSVEEQKNIFSFPFNREIMPEELFDVVQHQLVQSSAIDEIFISDNTFFGNRYGHSHNTTIGQHENQSVREYRVSNNFADFFHAKMIMGRFWNENDAPDVAVVDETFAALFPDNNPVGMNINGKTIIGIVENIQMHKENQRFVKQPVFYSPFDKTESMLGVYVKAIAGKQKDVQQLIMQIQKEFYPEFSRYFTDFQTEISYVMSEEDAFSRLFGIFSVICMILCLLSIYSAITMNTEVRRKEVAIRKINGAAIKDVNLLFGKSYIKIWSVVCVFMFPVIYFAGNLWLERFHQRISLNVFFFSGIYFSVLALIFLIIIFRIMEVARCNPADVLKSE